MKINNIINVIDVEATCWESLQVQGSQPMEIIEIGITELDLKTLDIKNSKSFYVQPSYSSISKFCTKLTGITDSFIIKNGKTFSTTIHELRDMYLLKKRHWASWGNYDYNQLLSDCNRANLDFKTFIHPRHVNLKTNFSLLIGSKHELSVEKALKHLNLKFNGRPHNGMDDSYNIARIYKHILEKFRT